MATVFPPPSKRQRLAAAETAKTQQEIDTIPPNLGSIRIQFYDQASGKPTGGPVSVPVVDASVKNLELLVNSLLGNVCTLRPSIPIPIYPIHSAPFSKQSSL